MKSNLVKFDGLCDAFPGIPPATLRYWASKPERKRNGFERCMSIAGPRTFLFDPAKVEGWMKARGEAA